MSNNSIIRTGWEVATVGEVLKLKSGDFLNFASMDSSGIYPVYGGNGINGYHSTFMFEESKIVIGRVGVYCGSIHYTQPNSWITDNALYVVEKDPRLLDEYLVLALRYANLNQYSSQSGQPLISTSKINNVKILIPPLAEQRRIAGLLARADRLRRLRRYARQLSDTYLQSVFVEMFYKQANKSWPKQRIGGLVLKGTNKIRTGPFGSQLLHSEFREEGDVAVLGIDNAVQNFFAWGKPRYITLERYKQLKRYTVFPGDVIITIMATTGRCAVVPESIPLAINTKHLCCITLDQEKCLPSFLHASFLYSPLVLRQMGGSERGAIMPGLNMEIIKNLEISLPPLTLQERFADVVQRYERLRTQQVEAERQTEMLFQSLLAQAFS